MKKFVLTLTAILGLAVVSDAQSFTFQKGDTVKGVASDLGIELHNDINNTTSSAYKITWKIISHNLPASSKWQSSFGLCDNKLCYGSTILAGSTQTTDDIAASSPMTFKIMTGDLSGVTQNGPFYISVQATQGSFIDTTTFILNKWATNVSNVNKNNDNVALYPNPAKDDINVVFNGLNDIKTVGIYNLIGKMQSIYKVSGSSANINVSNLPSGIYLVRLMDNQGHVVAIRKFNKQ